MAKKNTRRSLAAEAAMAHSNLNAYHSVIALLEGGIIYDGRDGPAQKIIAICNKACSDELKRYDSAIAKLERLP